MRAAYDRRVPAPRQTRAYLALTLVAALWGSYPALAKLALAHFPPYLLVGLRMSLASALLVFLLLRRGMEQFRALQWAVHPGQPSFFTSARIFSGSGSSPRPYRSMKRTVPLGSMMNVARTLAFQSGQYTP